MTPGAALSRRLADAMSADVARLARRIEQASARRAPPQEWSRLAADVERSIARRDARRARVPPIAYPPGLPVAQRAGEIAAAIREHPVVIVGGETGSGKTTQLPKVCLSVGRGVRGLIGHTQPRRIAARAVAARIAHELSSDVGDYVGYKVRFTDRTKPDAFVKLMTDGILLAETQHDRLLSGYDTIIVDEAHERSLNIDFLLGYLKQLLPQRPDLKVIVTSATLDAQRFARHFATGGIGAPVIEVSGRAYPVDVRYRPLSTADEEADDEEELEEVVVAVVEDLWRDAPGDVLVFLPGEREIRETSDLLSRALARRPYASAVEILPLYARLTVEEQQRVFAPSRGRRVVLATNVAETSLTVPGIRYVVDSGLARVKRYSVRNKTTLLQIEKISQAAATQRAGRCGRVGPGICVRLYGDDDFAARPSYTDPEILRSSLAAVILRMAALDLGAVDRFPFVEAPPPRAIADGYQQLQDLGAIDAARALTPVGRELARLPVDPRIGRMILAARDRGCLAEVLVIASALSVPDPRERPLEKQQAADQAHQRFRDERSDFVSFLALWAFHDAQLGDKLPHRKRVEACRAQFVSHLRLTEWRDVHTQLAAELAELGVQSLQKPASDVDAARYESIHRSLLAGLLSNIGAKSDDDGYDGARGIRFHLHPGSALARKPPKWVLAAELVETSRLYARCAGKVEPEWIEEAAGDRVEREYFDPRWDVERGEVTASERTRLYGLTLGARRRVSFGRVDAEAARDIFVREALVPGALGVDAPFVAHNRRMVAEVAELEHKARRQDVLVGEDAIAAFYAERVPRGVHSRATFERWRRDAEVREPKLLFVTREALMRHAAREVTEVQYPETLAMAGTRLALKYRFAPGHPRDGLTLTVPLALLNQLDADRLGWLVPGMIREKVTAYLKGLPKALRNRFVPLPDAVTAFLQQAPYGNGSLTGALRDWIASRTGERIPAAVLDEVELPTHLRVNVRVVDAAGAELGESRDLVALRAQLGQAAQLTFARHAPSLEPKGLRQWDFGDLPETLTRAERGARITGYPALAHDGESVSIVLLDTREAADASHRNGVVRLICIALKDALARFERGAPPGFAASALQLKPAIATDRLFADVMAAICDRAFVGDDPLPRSEQAFAQQVKRARTRLPAVADSAFRLLSEIAEAYHAVTLRIGALPGSQARLAAQAREWRDALVHPGFFGATPWAHLTQLPRYLRALDRRLAKQRENPARDARHAEQIAEWRRRHAERAAQAAASGRVDTRLDEFRWLLEELAVSLFAQELRTPFPVSYKRVERAWTELDR